MPLDPDCFRGADKMLDSICSNPEKAENGAIAELTKLVLCGVLSAEKAVCSTFFYKFISVFDC